MKLLTNFKQTTATHISNHIHEWRRRHRMIKTYVPNQLLAEWFIKSLLPYITEDVAKGGVVTVDQVISHAQYLDLIYTQFGTLYHKIPNAPRPVFTVPPPPLSKDSHVDDSVIGSSSTQTIGRPFGQRLAISNQTSIASDNTLASEINFVSSDKGKNEKRPGSKKKGKAKKKQNPPPQEKSSYSSSPARKPRCPCLIYNEDHFTRYCPHRSEVSKLLKTSSASAVLTNPFLNLETHLVATDHASTSQVLILSTSKPKIYALVSTRSKDYGNPSSLLNNQASDQPNPLTSTSSNPITLPIVLELTIKPPK